MRCSSVSPADTPRRPMPGKANSPRARHSPRHRSTSWGLTSRCRATSPILRPPSISLIAAIFRSRLYILRAKSIHLSIQCIRPLNFVSHFWGAVHDVFNILYRVEPKRMREEGFDHGEAGVRQFASVYGVLEKVTTIEAADNACSKAKVTTTVKRRPGASPLLFGGFLMNLAAF